ncbi:hypothetical protein DYH09_00855 [bacterium CPR1]|nr:hypothetical protein [bacterium CPR1]
MPILVGSNLDFNNTAKAVNLPDPTTAQDAATKAYVDAAIEGLASKDSCRVSTQSNTNLASPGASIDGVTMASGDRVLVRSQTTAAENGIYIWNGSSVAMTRSADCSTFAELEQAVTSIEEGTDVSTTWRQTAVNGTLGSTSVTWVAFGSSTPDASETVKGKLELATQAETDAGTDDARAVTPLKLATSPFAKKKVAQLIGDGSATQFDITHNLATRDVQVEVYRNSGSYDTILCDVSRTDTNTVRLNFASAPTSNQFKAVIIG